MTAFHRADWRNIPPQILAELDGYITRGEVPESRALIAILANDLGAAVLLNEPFELAHTVVFLHAFCPVLAWGSGERIADWERRGGLGGTCVHWKL